MKKRKLYIGLLIFILAFSSCSIGKKAEVRSFSSIRKKYSAILGVDEKGITNAKLYFFIEEWYKVPYKYGGKSKRGVDCSGFASVLYKEIFGKEMGGSSASILRQCENIRKDNLREGDLVFFRIDAKEITHMGIYLQNNKFVHASSLAGVTIEDLSKEYYLKYFDVAGRLKEKDSR